MSLKLFYLKRGCHIIIISESIDITTLLKLPIFFNWRKLYNLEELSHVVCSIVINVLYLVNRVAFACCILTADVSLYQKKNIFDLSCFVLSCLVLSFHVLSCPVLPGWICSVLFIVNMNHFGPHNLQTCSVYYRFVIYGSDNFHILQIIEMRDSARYILECFSQSKLIESIDNTSLHQ